ncbi:intradiol ring-cleavage dioxygenase [Sphingomonas sp. C3-2]|uniref:intradiol ring-cleavage dioxygenase n=1 Tax=Sphingomonas sp. C3-2 TaxID=3062169 RepID=UPI00294AC113|nr:intradiol ring-cleavage dioxygenase [Sphingomonas sp. C3-2]WOK35816.1 intradiol ring-cleavage dioxygenase [Sphingomonas sp. C3-2]
MSDSTQAITRAAINAISADTPPRTREVMTSLITHLHDFARDVNLTIPEWLAACDLLKRAGDMTDERRNEFILVSDVLGLESLVDALTNHAEGGATESAVLGPFFREDAPRIANGESIVRGGMAGETVFVEGYVTDAEGKPIEGAEIDVWETSPNGLYEQQDPDQPEMNLRGKLFSDANGYYAYKALKPVSYPIPFDGPAGDLLQLMGRHPYRPAHIHYIVRAPGCRTLVTQIFDRTDKYNADDSVFAVKDSLLVDFTPAEAGADYDTKVRYDIQLAPAADSAERKAA